jgi:indole-3-glycerol phosphate synthase
MHDSILHILNTTKTRIQAFGPDIHKEGPQPQFQKRDFIALWQPHGQKAGLL